jgi:autotransporter-associated beta strand protein
LVVNAANGGITFSSAIGLGATDSFIKTGSGTVILNGTNTFTGDTFVNQGILQVGNNTATFNDSLLGGSGGIYPGNIFIGTGATFLIGSHVNQTLGGIISGDGKLIKSQSGTLTLGNSNTYTGQTTITPTNSQDATISITSFNSVVGGTVSSSLGAPTTAANGTIVLGNAGSGRRAAIIYTGAGETTDRVINFTFNNNGSRHTISNTGAGLLKFTSAAIVTGSNQGHIILGGNGNGEFTQGIPLSFANLAKNDNGTWTLGGVVNSGLNATYGLLTVNAGTLALQKKSSLHNGDTALWTAAKINVKSGATLALNVDSDDVNGLSATSLDTLLTNIYGGTSTAQGLQAGAILGLDTSTATGGSFTLGNAITNSTGTGGGSLGLTKLGTGTLFLDKANTYSGATTISGGTLILTGATQATSAITFIAGSLGLDTGVTVTASSAAVNLANGTISVTGTTGASSYTLLTAASITGNPVLVSPVSGYELQVVGSQLLLVRNDNISPEWLSAPVAKANATEDAAYNATLADDTFDANNDPLTFAIVSGPAWLSVAPDGTLSGTPSNSDVGANVFTVSVSDGIAEAVEATLNITVINTNDAPVWAANPVILPDIDAGTEYVATLAGFASDADAGTFLTFSNVDGPSWLSVAADGTLFGTPGASDAGLNVCIVSVSDGIAEPVNTTLNITVISISDEQLWKSSFGDADLSDLSADYDGDGLSNGEERIWGLDPTKGSSRNPIITPLNPATGKFHYTRRDPARTGKTFTVWTSGNLVNWTQDTAATQLPGPIVDLIETVEVTLTAPPVNGRLFVRVHASD